MRDWTKTAFVLAISTIHVSRLRHNTMFKFALNFSQSVLVDWWHLYKTVSVVSRLLKIQHRWQWGFLKLHWLPAQCFSSTNAMRCFFFFLIKGLGLSVCLQVHVTECRQSTPSPKLLISLFDPRLKIWGALGQRDISSRVYVLVSYRKGRLSQLEASSSKLFI